MNSPSYINSKISNSNHKMNSIIAPPTEGVPSNHYSYRNATIGSTRVARRAGT